MPTSRSKPLIIVDAFHLWNALTGIRTYTVQLCMGLDGNAEALNGRYKIVPDWKRLNQSNFLKGKLSWPRKIINHVTYLFWKQVALPIICWWRRPDVLFCPDFVLPVLPTGCRTMVVIHDVFFWEIPENYPGLWRRYFTRMVEKGIKRNSFIISTSKFTSSRIRDILGLKNPVRVLYQCPKYPETGGHDPEITLEKYGIRKSMYFLHVGVMDKRKNLTNLVSAFKSFVSKHPDYKLVLVGERGVGSKQDDYDNIVKAIDGAGIGSSVVLTGFAPEDELIALYSSAFAYVFPSKLEGFGIPVLEAMAYGLPVLISCFGPLPEIAGKGNALEFDPEDPTDITSKMNEVTDDSIRNPLIVNGRKRAAEFSKDNFVQDLDKLVTECLGHNGKIDQA